MKYCILEAFNIPQLEDAVTDLIKSGWEPQGGFSVSPHNTYCQAMILKN